MTAHDARLYTREEVLAVASKPAPRGLGALAAILAVVGAITFLVGLFVAPDRAWRALHANWLFFATISSAGVMFVAAQRITTARWSRPIIRFLEGYVAFLPVAL
ncbi:MAG TPA: hypothetical protein VNA89_14190, partial [Gemmatimonadaceae bacterium]|nr:hypothetical protein [Gemmatimonadaceae bacterium]